MSVKSLELRNAAGRLVTEARGIITAAETEKRSMNAEEQTRFDDLHNDADGRLAEADRLERQERADAGAEESDRRNRQIETGDKPKPTGTMGRRSTDEYSNAFVEYLKRGEQIAPEHRATLQVDSDIGGGFMAASERFIGGILAAVDDSFVIRQLITKFQCSYGETLGQITLDSDLGDFEWGAGELTSGVEDTGLAIGKRELKPRSLKRKMVKVSRALLESPRINAEAIVQQRAAVSLARTLEKTYMTGDGATQPLGLFIASADGIPASRDVVTGSTTAYTGDGLITAQGTLKDAYQGNARWLLHRDSVTGIRKLKDGNGVYLWQPGLTSGQPNLILSKPYVVSEYAPNTFSNGNYGAVYGDFSFYYAADAMSMSVQRLIEMYALTAQIGFLFGSVAADGMPVMGEAFVRVKFATA